MAVNRYARDARIGLGTSLATARVTPRIRAALKSGVIVPVSQVITTGEDRLDTLAGAIYGDGRLWWLLAAASDIGWGMQVPPGTVVNVVRIEDLDKVL